MASSRLAVLGSPIAHSKSPALHRAAYRALGLDWSYDAVEVPSGALAGFFDGLDASWRGLSLTMPLKQEVLPMLDGLDELSRITGAANTVRFTDDGRRLGANTDVAGIVRALREAGVERTADGVVIGGGATAASALAALAELGAGTVRLAVRDAARAEDAVRVAHALGLRVEVEPIAALADAAAADVTISTVPGRAELGVRPSPALRASVLLDVAYDPWPSPLAELWAKAGGRVVPGILMLLHQALLQVRVFTSGDLLAPLDDEPRVLAAMRAAL